MKKILTIKKIVMALVVTFGIQTMACAQLGGLLDKAKNAAKAEASRSKQDEAMAAEIAAQQKRLEEEYEAARRASNYHVKSSGSVVSRGLECPKAIVRMNRKKREAAEKAARKAAAKKGKK